VHEALHVIYTDSPKWQAQVNAFNQHNRDGRLKALYQSFWMALEDCRIEYLALTQNALVTNQVQVLGRLRQYTYTKGVTEAILAGRPHPMDDLGNAPYVLKMLLNNDLLGYGIASVSEHWGVPRALYPHLQAEAEQFTANPIRTQDEVDQHAQRLAHKLIKLIQTEEQNHDNEQKAGGGDSRAEHGAESGEFGHAESPQTGEGSGEASADADADTSADVSAEHRGADNIHDNNEAGDSRGGDGGRFAGNVEGSGAGQDDGADKSDVAENKNAIGAGERDDTGTDRGVPENAGRTRQSSIVVAPATDEVSGLLGSAEGQKIRHTGSDTGHLLSVKKLVPDKSVTHAVERAPPGNIDALARNQLDRIAGVQKLSTDLRYLMTAPGRTGSRAHRPRGRLDARAYARAMAGAPDVFAQRWHEPGHNTAVCICLDVTSSMSNRFRGSAAIEDARSFVQAVLAVTEQTRTPVSVISFANDSCWLTVPWDTPSAQAKRSIALRETASTGYTVVHPALINAGRYFRALPAHKDITRRIVLLVCDGDDIKGPGVVNLAVDTLREVYGIDAVYGIGIEVDMERSSGYTHFTASQKVTAETLGVTGLSMLRTDQLKKLNSA